MNSKLISVAVTSAMAACTVSPLELSAANTSKSRAHLTNNAARAESAFVTSEETKDVAVSSARRKNRRPLVALALGGGGVRGAAHIGVLRAFGRAGIEIDSIAGCSMGALVGGLYSAGVPLSEIEGMMKDGSLQRAYAPWWVRSKLFNRSAVAWASLLGFKCNGGLVSGKRYARFIEKLLPPTKRNIEDLDVEFCAVVTNLLDGKSYKLSKGNLAQALLASSAIPPIVKPVKMNGALYVDGGCRANLPTVSARQFGAPVVIAVSVDEELQDVTTKQLSTVASVANRVATIMLSVADHFHEQKADIVIAPNLSGIPILSANKDFVSRAVLAGEEAAKAKLPEIKAAIERAQNEIYAAEQRRDRGLAAKERKEVSR